MQSRLNIALICHHECPMADISFLFTCQIVRWNMEAGMLILGSKGLISLVFANLAGYQLTFQNQFCSTTFHYFYHDGSFRGIKLKRKRCCCLEVNVGKIHFLRQNLAHQMHGGGQKVEESFLKSRARFISIFSYSSHFVLNANLDFPSSTIQSHVELFSA